MRKHDVVVVGGGPAGLYTAFCTRKREVTIIEEHEKVGSPKHCAGIVGGLVAGELAKISPNLVDHSYKNIVFITPSRKYVLSSKVPMAFHVNRQLLEEVLASKVESLGHRVLLKTRALPYEARRVKAGGQVIEFETLIIADGAGSLFRRTLIGKTPNYVHGLQVVARTSNTVPDDTLIVIFSELTPTFFSWIIPLDKDTVKIGLASKAPKGMHVFSLAEKRLGIKVTSIGEKFGGLIPIHSPLENPVVCSSMVFHGDSVPLTKPYTGGGLYYIFKLSPILAKCVDDYRLQDYSGYYARVFRVKNALERLITEFSRKTRYFVPVPFISALFKLGVVVPSDFDEHLRVALKALALVPAMLALLY
ncbi:MAG: NAD(P)/FAD-dependent oxidoreductase [Desulfurococcaceae archaeon]